jgi:hypothetical protein
VRLSGSVEPSGKERAELLLHPPGAARLGESGGNRRKSSYRCLRQPSPGHNAGMTRQAVVLLFLYQAAGWIIFAVEDPSRHGEIHFRGPDLFGIGGLIVIVLYAVYRANRATTAFEAVYIALIAVSLTLGNFADVYLLSGWQHWSVPMNHRTALALSVSTFTTAGNAGVEPVTDYARGLVTWQMIVDLVLVTVLLALVAHRVAVARGDARATGSKQT